MTTTTISIEDLNKIVHEYKATLARRKSLMPDSFKYFMHRDELKVPQLNVGDQAFVLHGYSWSSTLNDLMCGDTTVTRIKKNGTIVLANGYEFHAGGNGLAKNNACVVQNNPAHPWNRYDMYSVECQQILDACRKIEED